MIIRCSSSKPRKSKTELKNNNTQKENQKDAHIHAVTKTITREQIYSKIKFEIIYLKSIFLKPRKNSLNPFQITTNDYCCYLNPIPSGCIHKTSKWIILNSYRGCTRETFFQWISGSCSNLGIASAWNHIEIFSKFQVALQPNSRKIGDSSAPSWQHYEFPTKIQTNIVSNTYISKQQNRISFLLTKDNCLKHIHEGLVCSFRKSFSDPPPPPKKKGKGLFGSCENVGKKKG